ncbi:plasmid partition protein ParG [Thioalkalivibrio thiocyanoxidans]|uniref:plasmid partition protein ParG n=1 Tax=Thioalkalivibrio thiocyanoxidans TaxID=152475 RepID=UPI00035C45EC|nr:plasmid partition protein ParG [Thioalkalivibrio thiocyanoxidans]
MSKHVSIGGKPSTKNVDEWVGTRATVEKPKLKRLTIDIPEELHRKIKMQCAERGTKIAEEVRQLLESKYQ